MFSVKIGKREIGKNKPVFIIAEAGVNYNNNLDLAYKMIDVASHAGADAIKFQTWITKEMQLRNSNFVYHTVLIKKLYSFFYNN